MFKLGLLSSQELCINYPLAVTRAPNKAVKSENFGILPEPSSIITRCVLLTTPLAHASRYHTQQGQCHGDRTLAAWQLILSPSTLFKKGTSLLFFYNNLESHGSFTMKEPSTALSCWCTLVAHPAPLGYSVLCAFKY